MQWISRISHLRQLPDSKPPAPSARHELGVDRLRLSSEVTAVRVAGELDLFTVPTLAEVLEPCLSSDIDVIVLDLSEVSFLGAAALRLFEHAHQHTQHHGRTVRFVTGSRRVDRVLGIAESIGSGPFATYPTLEAAISGRCSGTIGPVSRPVSTIHD
jgi:anti-anti-sigma factor